MVSIMKYECHVMMHDVMIKKIGIAARGDLEQLLGKNVYLELFVKTVKKWREKDKYLSEFGFKDFEN